MRVKPRADRRKLGGHELPPEAQDRPEQNAGYDEAVHAGRPAEAAGEEEDALQIALDQQGPTALFDPDERATRDAVADVRRRERSAG